MTDKTVKVGDVVAWDEVPSGALVVDKEGAYSNRQNDGGRVVGVAGISRSWESRAEMLLGDPDGPWHWSQSWLSKKVRVVALNLFGNETADELRALAEAFEREHPAT